MTRCPICKGEVAPREQNLTFPFCSPRCRLIDLGRWLGGEYRVAAEEPEQDEPEEPPGE